MIKKILFVLAILAILGGSLAYYVYYMYNKPVASLENRKPDVVLTANDLLSAYEADETTASQLYNEKILQVKGVVSEIVTEGSVNKVFIETENPMSGVICEMEEGQDVTSLKIGSEVKIKGRCTGFLSDVVLVQSSLVKN